MSHSLRAKIKSLRYKGIITDKDCDRLCKALDNEKVLDKIKDEIEDYVCNHETNTEKAQGMLNALQILDKYREERGI